jgi:hypothetical protein
MNTNTPAPKTIGDALADLLKAHAEETATSIKGDLQQVAAYANQRLAHLRSIVNEPGYRRAVIAERDSIALQAAGRAIDQADAADAKLIGIIDGAISIAVGAIV